MDIKIITAWKKNETSSLFKNDYSARLRYLELKMDLNNKTSIIVGANLFALILIFILVKHIIIDHGSILPNLLLLFGLAYIRIFIIATENDRLQEIASLILFLLFDKDILDIKNVLLLLGVACIREQLRTVPLFKETISLSCGLMFLLMGSYSVGRIFIIYPLLLLFHWMSQIFISSPDFFLFLEEIFTQGLYAVTRN